MDDIDLANEHAARHTRIALARRMAEGPPMPEADETRPCLHCGRTLTGRRWCDAACRDAWQESTK